MTTGHVWTIGIPDLSGIQMVTVYFNYNYVCNFDVFQALQVVLVVQPTPTSTESEPEIPTLNRIKTKDRTQIK